MALNPNYVPLTPLWEVFTDKDLLTFLHDGYVKFYIDTERTVGKLVYQLTGSPPNYSYTPYGFLDTDGSWRVNMNLQGAFDQVIYGYPLDEFGNVQLYFADFFNVDGVFQFSREGFPNFFAAGGTVTTPIDLNYIPNGQFRIHNDIPITDTLELGQVRQPTTDIAVGGWTFDRPIASTARDFVTFQRIGSFVDNPAKSPRYAVEITCEAPHAGDTFKDLRVRFDDVNKFASDTVMFTFGVTSKVVSSGSITVELILIKNFGTGGDATTETNLTSFVVTSTFTPFYYSFVFGDNIGKIIGPDNDDYVQIALRMPANELLDVEFTDVLLTPGNVIAPVFNDTPTREFMYESLFDDTDVPLPDGSSIGLPLVLTLSGLRFDDSQVGHIFASTNKTPGFGELEADGTQFETLAHSSDGIPYSRLQKKLMNIAEGDLLPKWGTGRTFASTYYTNSAATPLAGSLRIANNSVGAITDYSDGTPATGFTFHNINSGSVNTNCWGLNFAPNSFYIWAKTAGEISTTAKIDAATSGFTVATIRDPVDEAGAVTNAPVLTRITFSVVTIVPATLSGKYFTFALQGPTKYYVWYKLDGVGTDPAPAGFTGIEVDLLSTWNAQEVAYVTAAAISGFKETNIIVTAAATIPNSSYFNLNASTMNYYVWYSIGGSGVDPMVPTRLGIEVIIESSDTISQVATKTLLAINSRYFATPDLRGMFLRGWDNGAGIDLDASTRWSFYNTDITGDVLGSYQFDEIYQLQISDVNKLSPAGGSYQASVTSAGLQFYGGSESRPLNAYVNYVIKY